VADPAETTTVIRELEVDGRLLRFSRPLPVEQDADSESCSLWLPDLELGSAGRNEAEAWELLADLVISLYLEFRDMPEQKLHPAAARQRKALMETTSGFYLRQPV
jgi:hypothetical protein